MICPAGLTLLTLPDPLRNRDLLRDQPLGASFIGPRTKEGPLVKNSLITCHES